MSGVGGSPYVQRERHVYALQWTGHNFTEVAAFLSTSVGQLTAIVNGPESRILQFFVAGGRVLTIPTGGWIVRSSMAPNAEVEVVHAEEFAAQFAPEEVSHAS